MPQAKCTKHASSESGLPSCQSYWETRRFHHRISGTTSAGDSASNPNRLATKCNGCRAPFSEEHGFLCKIGGPVNLRHNLLEDEWGNLCAKSLTPTAVSDKPRIHTGIQQKGEGARKSKVEAMEQTTHKRIARGEDPAEGGPGGEQEHTNGTPGDDNCRYKRVVGFWHDFRMTIFNIRITNITAASYKGGSTNQTLQKGGGI